MKTKEGNAELNLSQKEKELNDKRVSGWFVAFVGYVDEKDRQAQHFRSFFDKLEAKDQHPKSLVDLGCGDGVLSGKVCEQFKGNFSAIDYHGIDIDPNFTKSTGVELERKGIKEPHIITGSCFDQGVLAQLPEEVDLAVASNVAYYAGGQENLDSFVQQVTDRLGHNGVAVFMHEDKAADPNLYRTKYKAPFYNTKTTEQIDEAFSKAGLVHTEFSTDSFLEFPSITDDMWKELSKASYDYKPLMELPEMEKDLFYYGVTQYVERCSNGGRIKAFDKQIQKTLQELENESAFNQIADKLQGYPYKDQTLQQIHDLDTTKKLLEFIVQRPLEAIAAEGKLDNFLSDVKELLGQQNNQVIVRSKYQMALSKSHDVSFEKDLKDITEELKVEFRPSTQITSPTLDKDKSVTKTPNQQSIE